MSGLMRIAFVNISKDTAVTLQVETEDAVECCALLTTTPASAPEQGSGITHPAGAWQVEVPPGQIVGFITENPVKITNLNPAAVTTVYANGKDPWPQPPPLKPDGVEDFDLRYKCFLMVGAPPSAKPSAVIMTLACA